MPPAWKFLHSHVTLPLIPYMIFVGLPRLRGWLGKIRPLRPILRIPAPRTPPELTEKQTKRSSTAPMSCPNCEHEFDSVCTQCNIFVPDANIASLLEAYYTDPRSLRTLVKKFAGLMPGAAFIQAIDGLEVTLDPAAEKPNIMEITVAPKQQPEPTLDRTPGTKPDEDGDDDEDLVYDAPDPDADHDDPGEDPPEAVQPSAPPGNAHVRLRGPTPRTPASPPAQPKAPRTSRRRPPRKPEGPPADIANLPVEEIPLADDEGLVETYATREKDHL